jgi:hypothetical protein
MIEVEWQLRIRVSVPTSWLVSLKRRICSDRPQNAKRLLTALRRVQRKKRKPSTAQALRREMGLVAAM